MKKKRIQRSRRGLTFASSLATMGFTAMLVAFGLVPLLQGWPPTGSDADATASQARPAAAAGFSAAGLRPLVALSLNGTGSLPDASREGDRPGEDPAADVPDSTSQEQGGSAPQGAEGASAGEGASSSSGSASASDDASSSSSAGSAGSSASDGAGEPAAGDEAAPAADGGSATRTLKQGIEAVDGTRYTVMVEYGEDAGIPEDARLSVVQVLQKPGDKELEKKENEDRPYDFEKFVSAKAMRERSAKLEKALDVKEDDVVLSARYLDIAILADGKEIQPAAPVKVTLKTNAVPVSESDAVEASFFTEKKAAGLDVENESTKKDGTVLSFEADKFSELGIAVVAAPLASDAVRGFDFSILYARDGRVQARQTGDAVELGEDMELLETLALETRPDHDFDTTVWVQAEPAEGADAAGASSDADGGADADDGKTLVTYIYGEGELERQLLAADEGRGPVAVSAKDTLALVWGTPGDGGLLQAQDEGDGGDEDVTGPAAGFTVKWVGEDGQTLETDENVAAGEMPSFDGTAPEKEGYDFAGWTPELAPVAGDVTYQATYTKKTYTIIWVDHDGKELWSQVVEHGVTPVYGGQEPSAWDNKSFSHWDPTPVPASANATYTAQYSTAGLQVNVQYTDANSTPVKDAQFTLTNKDGILVWVSDATSENGIVEVPKLESEGEQQEGAPGGGATFAPGSAYTLKQVDKENSEYFCPQGSWTLTVGDDGAYAITTNKAAGDYSTENAAGPYGSLNRIYLKNHYASYLVYDYHYPDDAGAEQPKPDPERLGFLSYDGAYTVDADDPILGGYEFAGWQVDATTSYVKHGQKVALNTLNYTTHTLTACWRIPLHVEAYTYSAGDSGSALPVKDSAGTFKIGAEKSLTFKSLSEVCASYGEQNTPVSELNVDADYSFAFAELKRESDSVRVEALRYDAGGHSWQYREAGGSTAWTNIAHDDTLKLYYTSDLMHLQWVLENEDGSFEPLDSDSFPSSTVAVSGGWTSSEDLVPASARPVVFGTGYYHYIGLGASGAEGLEVSGLQSFQVRNTESGFRYRTGSSGDGSALQGDTIYVVYSATPPDGSSYLRVENRTELTYRMNGILFNGEISDNNILAQSRVILVGDEGRLSAMEPGYDISAGTDAQLVLLGTGGGTFVLDGGFVEMADVGTVVSAAVASPDKVVRTAIEQEAGANALGNTKTVTRGRLVGMPNEVVVSFDSDLRDLAIVKEWSDDSYPASYAVDLNLFERAQGSENDLPCVTAQGSGSGVYTVRAGGGWTVVVPDVPARCLYSVTEKAIRNGGTDITDQFQATSTVSGDTITVSNVRSNPVCRVGAEEFTTVKAAVEYIKEQGWRTPEAGAVVEMIDDYAMAESGSVEIPAGFDIELTTADGLTPKIITRGFSGEADLFLVKGALTIENVTLTGRQGNTWMTKAGNGGLVTVGEGATLTAGPGSAFTNGRADNGSAIFAANGATVNLAGARVTDNRSISGGAIGVADASCRINLSGETFVYDNRIGNGDANTQRNICLDQDSNEVIQVTAGGLGDAASVGVYVPGGETLYNAHGLPAKPFATFAGEAADAHLEKLQNDLVKGPAKNGAASVFPDLANTAVWGETFSFTAKVQWLDDKFLQRDAPANAEVRLTLNGGYTTPSSQVATVIDVSATAPAPGGWACVFTGLAKYDVNGNPCKYVIVESELPADYRQVVFTGDVAVQDNPLTYGDAAGDGQQAYVSNYYKYTGFTVHKEVKWPEGSEAQGLKAAYSIYGVLKDGADYYRDGVQSGVRKGGVGSVSDLPLALRGVQGDAGKFYTGGGNHWFVDVSDSPVPSVGFHAFYDCVFGQFEPADATSLRGIRLKDGGTWRNGDVVRLANSECWVYVEAADAWRRVASCEPSYLSFNRQDGIGGVEGVGGEASGKGGVLDCAATATASDAYLPEDKTLSADYYYYAVETGIQETNVASRSISGTHRLVATYDPRYAYDQQAQETWITNTRQDFLSVDKEWPADVTNPGPCEFDVYKIVAGTDSKTLTQYLSDASKFRDLVTGTVQDEAEGDGKYLVVNGTRVGELAGSFTLPEEGTQSWVHVLNGEDAKHMPEVPNDSPDVYFVRERSAGGVTIVSADTSISSGAVEAVYAYNDKIDQITVSNLSEILCKVVDNEDDPDPAADHAEHPFRTLNAALEYGRTRAEDKGSNKEFTIYLLRDYSIPQSDVMTINAGEKIVLTTASTTEGDYRYRNKDDAGKTRATITRKAGNALSLVTVNGTVGEVASTAFQLENIELNGGGTSLKGNGGLINASNATIVLQEGGHPAAGVEMGDSVANNGGAIYAASSDVSVSDAYFHGCGSTDTSYNDNERAPNRTRGGGAIWTSGVSAKVVDTAFDSCSTPRSGSALACMAQNGMGAGEGKTEVVHCTFTNCTATGGGQNGGGTVYSDYLVLDVRDSTFGRLDEEGAPVDGCVGNYHGGGIFHFNMTAASEANGGTGSVTNVAKCEFYGCSTTSGGDNKADRHGGGGLCSLANRMNLEDSTFLGCATGMRGAGALHFNLAAESTMVKGCKFYSCEAKSSGGGGAMGLTGLDQHIVGCTFEDCSALKSAGGAIDIAHFKVDKEVTVEGCAFTNCVSGSGNGGGGICSGGRKLTVRTTVFDGCKTQGSKPGGAVSMSVGGNMEELDIYGCTFTGCEVSGSDGGAVYAKGAVLRLDADEATGARNRFESCSATSQGGAIRQEKNAAGTIAEVKHSDFSSCAALNGNCGGLRTDATAVDLTDCTFSECTAKGNAGSVYQGIYSTYQESSHLIVRECAFQSSVAGANGGSGEGGAIYTEAKELRVEGTGSGTFKDCTSWNRGGAVFHNKNIEKSSATFIRCEFDNCHSANSEGGAVRTYAPTVTLDYSTFRNCGSKGNGGAVCQQQFSAAFEPSSSFTATDCVFGSAGEGDGITSSGEGGAICTEARTLTVKGETRRASFTNCSSYNRGGAIFHNRNTEKSSATVENCDFANTSSANGYGGAICAYATTLKLDGATFDTNTSKNTGGAIYHSVNGSYIDGSWVEAASCTFAHCQALSASAGALYTNAERLKMTGEPDVLTFTECHARSGNGGALCHDKNTSASITDLTLCSFLTCVAAHPTSVWNYGGGVYTIATKLKLDRCSFEGCTSRRNGGAVYHNVNGTHLASSDATVEGSAFKGCSVETASGGGICTNAQALKIVGVRGMNTFEGCEAQAEGGAVYHSGSSASSTTTIDTCAFVGCKSRAADGGGLWTYATKLFAISPVFQSCSAQRNGGAVYHALQNNDQIPGSLDSIEGTGSATGCTATVGRGGAWYSAAQEFKTSGAGSVSFTRCSAAYDGGALYLSRNTEDSTATLANCFFSWCWSQYAAGNESRGGGAYVRPRALLVVGGGFEHCTAKNAGGCLAHNPEVNPSDKGPITLTIENATFDTGVTTSAAANDTGGRGGAVYSARSTVTMKGCTVRNCVSAYNGGGLYQHNADAKPVTLDGCTFTGNSAALRGGAVYFDSNNAITLRNGTSITDNKLGNATVDNAAGVYIWQDANLWNTSRSKATLVLGAEGVGEDTVTVYDNLTSAGEQSNVRLVRIWSRDGNGPYYQRDRDDSVSFLSNLVKPGVGRTGTIGVCNPGPEGTRFGLGDVGGRTGVEYVESDIDTLYGMLQISDHEQKIVVWHARKVCKITDENGWAYNFGDGKAAAFSSLEEAIEVLNNMTAGYLYNDHGETPQNLRLEMLVPDYTLPDGLPVLQRSVTLATAKPGPKEDDYPLNATSEHAVITRGEDAGGSMLTVGSGVRLKVEGVTLDGGDRDGRPLVAETNGGIVYVQPDGILSLGQDAVLQNSSVGDGNSGGAVYVTGSSDSSTPSLVMEMNATIRDCSAGSGGGAYLTGGVLFDLTDEPRIEGCSASQAGGAVYVSPFATMNFSGVDVAPHITGNFVTSPLGDGAGIYLPDNDAKLNLRMGSHGELSGNYVAGSQDGDRRNGEDAYPVLYQDIYLGEGGEPVTSVNLTGNISQPDGSNIYVWARTENHYKSEMQFAVVDPNAGALRDSSLAVFRNARDNEESENETDTYLYGIYGDGNEVIWSYSPATSAVILRKVAERGGGYESLAGATFTVYKGRSGNAYVVKHADGTRETLAGLTSGANGVFWIGTLPYGTYYLHETGVPDGYSTSRTWFRLIIDENGVTMSEPASSRSAL